jgi:hypothetical protein
MLNGMDALSMVGTNELENANRRLGKMYADSKTQAGILKDAMQMRPSQ